MIPPPFPYQVVSLNLLRPKKKRLAQRKASSRPLTIKYIIIWLQYLGMDPHGVLRHVGAGLGVEAELWREARRRALDVRVV